MELEQINRDHIILTILGLLLSYLPWLFLRIKTGCNNEKMKMDFYSILSRLSQNSKNSKKIKIGMLTNELPPIIYGGVSTWVLNFMKMFQDDPDYEVVPIFLAYQDKAPDNFVEKYKGIRIINSPDDLSGVFEDVDILVNNLWIALDTIQQIKQIYPNLPIVSVCHSLIQMEHITNLGSQYTSNWEQQEVTFKNSDYVILISEAEKKYYESFGYDKFEAVPIVIYNSYKSKHPEHKDISNIKYDDNTVGYIGRHVPRKRPELPILAVSKLKKLKQKVINMGVDFNKGGNKYWRQLMDEYKQLEIIPFSCDKKIKERFWNSIGVCCITGIYEPFGYTICEALDRLKPVIVQNIDGPLEIIGDLKDNVFMYEVDQDIEKDVENFSKALQKFWETPAETRKEMAKKARNALKRFTPEVIKEDWKTKVFQKII